MDKEAAEIIAAAMHAQAEATKMNAAATAIQAEAHALIAAKMDELTNTIRGAQARIDRGLKPTVDRASKTAAEIVARIESAGKRP